MNNVSSLFFTIRYKPITHLFKLDNYLPFILPIKPTCVFEGTIPACKGLFLVWHRGNYELMLNFKLKTLSLCFTKPFFLSIHLNFKKYAITYRNQSYLLKTN